MTLKYLAGKVKEYNQVSKDITVSTGITGDGFRAINYSASFFKESPSKHTKSFTIDNTKGNLKFTEAACTDPNCLSCNEVECYTCKNTHYLTNGDCKDTKGNALYFLSPAFDKVSKNPADAKMADVSITSKFTLSFFMKYMARVDNANNNVDVLRIGTNLKLRLSYNDSNSTAKLQLYSDKDSHCTIGDYGNYLPRFGKWTHISVAYFYDATKLAYFPANLNFQVDFVPVKTTYNCYNKILGITPKINITFPKEVIALYGRVSLWDTYFTGVWGYESFKTNSKAAIKEFIAGSCPTTANENLNCYRDYTKLTVKDDYCTTNPAMFNGTTCLAKQTKCPYGYFTDSATSDYCSCLNTEKDTWIVNKTDTRHYCKSKLIFIFKKNLKNLIYLNFFRA